MLDRGTWATFGDGVPGSTAPRALVEHHGRYRGPSAIARLVDSYVNRPREPAAEIADLTDRELDVLRAMARGLSNNEISRELYLAETTVKTHVARILSKLGVRDQRGFTLGTQLHRGRSVDGLADDLDVGVAGSYAGPPGRATPGRRPEAPVDSRLGGVRR